MAEDTPTTDDVEQPKVQEETLKTASAYETGSNEGSNNQDVSASLIKQPGQDMPDHEHALLVSSRRDGADTRTKGFVVVVAMAAALGGLIFGYDSKFGHESDIICS
jgi:hypothetical protein